MSRQTEHRSNVEATAEFSAVKKIITAGTYVLTLAEKCVNCVLAGATGDINITLPNAQLCPGAIVSVFVSASDGTNDVVVTGAGVGSAYTSGDLDATGDNVVVRSDGMRWIDIAKTQA